VEVSCLSISTVDRSGSCFRPSLCQSHACFWQYDKSECIQIDYYGIIHPRNNLFQSHGEEKSDKNLPKHGCNCNIPRSHGHRMWRGCRPALLGSLDALLDAYLLQRYTYIISIFAFSFMCSQKSKRRNVYLFVLCRARPDPEEQQRYQGVI
jgi:hypothetical protein